MAVDSVTVESEASPRSSRKPRLISYGADDLRGAGAPRHALALIIAITFAGGLLRFATLSQSIWFDEAFSIRETSGTFGQMLTSVVHHEGSPPLYFALLWLWRHLAGHTAVEMRTLSALAGTLTIPAAFLATRRLVGDRAGLIVSAFVASSPALLYYSQELRMYAVMILLSTLAFAAFVAILQSPRGLTYAAWALFSILAMATHYFAAVMVVPQAAWLSARCVGDRTRVRPTIAAIAPVLCAGLALLILMRYQSARIWQYTQAELTSPFVVQHITAAGAGASDWLPRDFQQLILGPGGPFKPWVTAGFMVVVMFGLWLVTRIPQQRPIRRGAELNLILLIPATAILAGLTYFEVFIEGRYFFACWVPVMTVVAAGLAAWRHRRRAVVVTGLLCAAWVAVGLISFFVPTLASREEVRSVARSLGVAARPRLIVIDQMYDVEPLLLYRPAASVYTHRTITVSELDVVLMPNRKIPSDTDADPPIPYAVPDLPRGLVLRQTIRGDTYIIERYLAPAPVTLKLYPSAGSFIAQWRFLYERLGGRTSSL